MSNSFRPLRSGFPCTRYMITPKYDFGDLLPDDEKSEIEKKIEEATARVHTNKTQPQRELNFVPKTEADKEIARDINIIEKGQKCENDVKYALSYLDRRKFRVMMNVHIHGINEFGELEDQEHDAIVVSNDKIWDIEAKSISGDILTIFPDGQWEVKSGYKTYAIPNPSAQVLRHKSGMLYRIQKLNISIEEIVCTNNTRLLIKDGYGKLPFHVTKTDILMQHIIDSANSVEPLDGRAALIYQEMLSGKRIYKNNVCCKKD